MIKLILLAKRKAGMSREAFIDYYENQHVPLVGRLAPGQSAYRRNYVRHDRVAIPPDFTGELEYDVVTEVIWKDRESHARTMEKAADPEIAQQIAEDEEKFFERESMRFFVVETHESDLSDSGGSTKS